MIKNNLIKIVKNLAATEIHDRANLTNLKRKLSNQLMMAPPLNSDLLGTYHQLRQKKSVKENLILERLLRKREIRTLSGVAVITVLTKPYSCPGKCIYCPTEEGMPKSYLSNEPAAARAAGTKFNPYQQVKVRLEALKINGHNTDKVELIVLGGSWSVYQKSYQAWFIKRCFEALNGKNYKTLDQAQKINERAEHRCIGLTLETRPDLINEAELHRMRQLGCTRVELGVQSIYDPILKLNKRGHTVKQTIEATAMLKQAGFKITYHMMPNLPGATVAKDLAMFEKLFSSADFQPDQLKIYPCLVTKNSELYNWYRKGKYKPYSNKQLLNLLIKVKKIIPPYVRIVRLIRDIPAQSIVAGNKVTNLRQLITNQYPGICRCIRCREAGHQKISKTNNQNIKIKLNIKKYNASRGQEYFISIDSEDKKILYAFLRLRVDDDLENNFFNELNGAAIIRELHTYGEITPIGKIGNQVQHFGLGKKLIAEAEKICRLKKIKKIAVISGIGVKDYYRKLGYKQIGTYLAKNLS